MLAGFVGLGSVGGAETIWRELRDPPCRMSGAQQGGFRAGCEGGHAGDVSWRVSALPTRRGSALDVCRERTSTEYLSEVKTPTSLRQQGERRAAVKKNGSRFPALALPIAGFHWPAHPLLFRVSKQRVWDAPTGPDFTSPHSVAHGESPVAHSHTKSSASPAFLRIRSACLQPFKDPRELFPFSLFSDRVDSAVLARRVTGHSGWSVSGEKSRRCGFFFFLLGRASGVP